MKYTPHYTTGLGKKTLKRAQIVFLVVIFLFLASMGTAVYAGMKTGELEKVIMQPVRQMATNIQESLETLGKVGELPAETDYSYEYSASSSSETTVDINSSSGSDDNPSNNGTSQRIQIQYNSRPTITNDAYEKARAEQEAWWREVQEENRMLSEESKRQLEEFKADSDRKFEEAKQQEQANMESFSAEQRAKQEAEFEAWKKEHGIN